MKQNCEQLIVWFCIIINKISAPTNVRSRGKCMYCHVCVYFNMIVLNNMTLAMQASCYIYQTRWDIKLILADILVQQQNMLIKLCSWIHYYVVGYITCREHQMFYLSIFINIKHYIKQVRNNLVYAHFLSLDLLPRFFLGSALGICDFLCWRFLGFPLNPLPPRPLPLPPLRFHV